MVAALSSLMERSRLANDDSRPAVVSSIFLSSKGKGKPFAIVVIVVLAAALAVVVVLAAFVGFGIPVTVTAAGASEYNSSMLFKHNNTGIIGLG